MTATGTRTPYRSGQQPGRDGFPQLLHAEWTKFRTVRGWVIAVIAAAALAALATVALAAGANGRQNPAANPQVAVGPGGEAVTDTFYFVHQPLAGDGSITVRVTGLTDTAQQPVPPGLIGVPTAQPWAKAGIIIKDGTRPGSAYAAIMVTPGHGVRMQYNYTHDAAGLPGPVSAASPRWLRLTRSGVAITGYDSADGTHWTKVGAATLTGLPETTQAGLFAASPTALVTTQGFASNNGTPVNTQATGVFDHVSLGGDRPSPTWRGGQVGSASGPAPQCTAPQGSVCIGPKSLGETGGVTKSGGTFTVAGSGDIAPYIPIVDPLGLTFKGTLVGLIAVIALGGLFITAEYRRGLIRTTLTASPRRGRVLLAKAIVIGAVTFIAGLIGAAVALPIAGQKLRSGGWVTSVYPAWPLFSGHGLEIVVGTAGLLAAAAVLALAAGAVLRRSAGAIAAVVVLIILPLILATVLPMAPAQWLLRLTPAAGFGLQQGTQQYAQVTHACLPYNGCYPLAPWNGFAVMCVWVVVALGAAVYLLRRRDA
jgi:ABC-type transport system involved in multi-copper enzyme maturation permease subunit/regulation of enolase protein 1 (concanavalin A-like superfamily)